LTLCQLQKLHSVRRGMTGCLWMMSWGVMTAMTYLKVLFQHFM
jgi:hypothetical protein